MTAKATAVALVALVSLISVMSSAQAIAQPLSIEWTLTGTKKPLEREALITVKDQKGQPVSDAAIEVNVDMPSMPMMHAVPKAIAKPAGEPGRYKTNFTLEMPGEWAARIEVTKPVRVKVIKKFNVE